MLIESMAWLIGNVSKCSKSLSGELIFVILSNGTMTLSTLEALMQLVLISSWKIKRGISSSGASDEAADSRPPDKPLQSHDKFSLCADISGICL